MNERHQKPHDQIEELRDAAATRVKATSLRGAAREIGLSPSGLQKFLDGTKPYEPTVHRLRAWYGDDEAKRERDAVIAEFLGLLPAQRRAAAEPILRTLLAGSLRECQALDQALRDARTGDRAGARHVWGPAAR